MMNARGLMALVAINLGYELGVVPRSLYAALVLMALATTALTTPLLLWLRRGTEIEEPIRASGFLKQKQWHADDAEKRQDQEDRKKSSIV